MPTAAAERTLRIGTDVIAVDRVARLVSEHPAAERALFTDRELGYCAGKRRRHEHLAARFAAKEAVLKAFGTGMGNRMRWTDVEVAHGRKGRPLVRLHGELRRVAERRGLEQIEVSLSHSAGIAMAQALAVWAPREG